VVDVAGRWGEGYYFYPGRSDLKWSEVSRSHIRMALSNIECHLKG